MSRPSTQISSASTTLDSWQARDRLLSDSWRGEPRRRIYQHERPVIPTPARRWGERLDAPTVLLLDYIRYAVARVVPELALLFGFDDALIQREALSAGRIDDGE